MKRTLSIALVCLATATAAPAESPQGTRVRGEILPGWQLPDGSRVAAIRLTLAPGWKTYWRSPGDAGIPPQFGWAGSENLRAVGISWPTPEVFDQYGMRSIGYSDTVILPLSIAPRDTGQPVRVEAALEIGVCHDVCVPEQLRLSATFAGNSTQPSAAIAAALAERPFSAAEAGVTGVSCRFQPKADGYEIEARIAMPSAGGEEIVVIEPGPADIWMSETDVRRKGNELTATGDMVVSDGGAMALDRSAIRITVLGRDHAVDIRGCTPD